MCTALLRTTYKKKLKTKTTTKATTRTTTTHYHNMFAKSQKKKSRHRKIKNDHLELGLENSKERRSTSNKQ